MRVHEHEERGDGVVADVLVDQVQAVRVYGQHGDGVPEHYGRDESDAAADPVRKTCLVLARHVLVLAELAVRAVQHGLRPDHQAHDGHGPGQYGFDANKHGRHLVLVTRLHRAHAVRRQHDVEQARGDQHEQKEPFDNVFAATRELKHRPTCYFRVRACAKTVVSILGWFLRLTICSLIETANSQRSIRHVYDVGVGIIYLYVISVIILTTVKYFS